MDLRYKIIFLLAIVSFYLLPSLWTVSEPFCSDCNVVLIVVDCLRQDHVGAYGYPRNTTPNIDVLAHQSTVFLNSYSSSTWTLPSVASILTGRYPVSHGALHEKTQISSKAKSLAQILADGGYATGGFISGPYLKSTWGFDRGFGTWDDSATTSDLTQYQKIVSSPSITDDALRWIEAKNGQRFFLFLHYFDPHMDYNPPSPYDEMFWDDPGKDDLSFSEQQILERIISLYDGEIAFTDHHLGKLFEGMKKQGLWDKTIIILTSDHGEGFYEHGFMGHRNSLYDELLSTPLIIRNPKGRSDYVRMPVSSVQIMPTLIDLLGIEATQGMDGESVFKIGENQMAHELYTKDGLAEYAIRTWDDEGVYKLHSTGDGGRKALYDLLKDPFEQKNIAGERPEILAELEGVAKTFYAQNTPLAGEKAEPDNISIMQLKSLGYLS